MSVCGTSEVVSVDDESKVSFDIGAYYASYGAYLAELREFRRGVGNSAEGVSAVVEHVRSVIPPVYLGNSFRVRSGLSSVGQVVDGVGRTRVDVQDVEDDVRNGLVGYVPSVVCANCSSLGSVGTVEGSGDVSSSAKVDSFARLSDLGGDRFVAGNGESLESRGGGCLSREGATAVDDSVESKGCPESSFGSARNDSVKFGPNGGISYGRGPNYEKHQARRVRLRELKNKKSWRRGEEESQNSLNAGSVDDELKATYKARLIAENKLAEQKAQYNFDRNEYMRKSRISEQQWETSRLLSGQKLEKAVSATVGSKPGFVETVVSGGLESPVPSLSDGTVSPNSSISVAEVQKMTKLIVDQASELKDLKLCVEALKKVAVGSDSFKGSEFDLNWKGKPVEYDSLGQEIMTLPSEPDVYYT